MRPGTDIFILSDFSAIEQQSLDVLHQIGKHSDLTAIQINDPMEASLPKSRKAWFTNGAKRLQIDLQNPRLRKRYAENAMSLQSRLASQLSSAGIRVIKASTEDSAQNLLEYYFNPRKQFSLHSVSTNQSSFS